MKRIEKKAGLTEATQQEPAIVLPAPTVEVLSAVPPVFFFTNS